MTGVQTCALPICLSPEQRAELEAFDKENEEMWLEQVEESIKEYKVINNLILRIITGEDY